MTIELKYLTWTALLTVLIWIPYILNMIGVRGLVDAVGYPENPKPLAKWAQRMKNAHYNAIENLAPFAALVLLAMGVAIVSVHNEWIPAWSLAITLTGWLLAVKGALFLVFPQIATKYARWPEATLRTSVRSAGAVLAVVGAVLTYLVWFGR